MGCDTLHVHMCIPTIHTYVHVYVYACICVWLTFESGGLVLLVYIDLVMVSLEMVIVIRDATLHSVSLMEEIVDLKDDELSAPQCCLMCVLPICIHVL